MRRLDGPEVLGFLYQGNRRADAASVLLNRPVLLALDPRNHDLVPARVLKLDLLDGRRDRVLLVVSDDRAGTANDDGSRIAAKSHIARPTSGPFHSSHAGRPGQLSGMAPDRSRKPTFRLPGSF